MFKGTMTKWPVQKLAQGTTQKLLQYHDADKTEHLPKPNDFRGPDFFPYYSLLKNLNKPYLSKPNTERLFGPILLFSL